MIAYVKGQLEEIGQDYIVLDIGYMGINIKISEAFISELPPIGTEMKVHTFTYVKEEAFSLYGFRTKDDLELFRMMITVNGIGPKGALAILSIMSGNELRFAIYAGDAKAISKANGIGAKTAERLILDLRDKVHIEDTLNNSSDFYSVDTVNIDTTGLNQSKKDAIEALAALGYSITDAAKAVNQVNTAENQDADSILKASLKFLI